jgi:CCR4-NOT transcription complex subunit 4
MSDDDSDDGEICPLCCEELDVTDKNFIPCQCGYQVRHARDNTAEQ